MAEISCGAKTRNGGTCKRAQMPNGRCNLHGGKSTGPKSPNTKNNASSPGSIYSQFLTEEEREIEKVIKLGNIDDELIIMRIRLRRTLDAERTANGAPELDEVTENDGGSEYIATETRKLKVRDYPALIDKTMARIESLEKTRKTLLEESRSSDGLEDMTRDDTTISPDEPIPEKPIL